MKIILLTIFGGLLLLWAGVITLLKWITPIEEKHILGLGGYLSVVTTLLIFVVINTSMTQQKAALTDTTTLLSEQVDNFRIRLGEITERLMGQIEEKAELTQSEMEVRGNLQQERAEHAVTQRLLAKTNFSLQGMERDRNQERDAHNAYHDSLNTERARHRDTRSALDNEQKAHRNTRSSLDETSRKLAARTALSDRQEKDLRAIRKDLNKAQDRAATAEKNIIRQLKTQVGQTSAHTEALILLQSSIDSVYRKVLKRPRVAPVRATD